MKKIYTLIFCLVLSLLIPQVLAISNESVQTFDLIKKAEACFNDMQTRNIPLLRANDSLQEAKQQYYAQLSLEKLQGQSGRYSLAREYATEVCEIQELAFRAQDELIIFEISYKEAAEETNISDMQAEYDTIYLSFNEERFEETPGLIEKGYSKLSEVQASQTAAKLFLEATTRGLKTFLI